MSENVIEGLLRKWKYAENQMRPDDAIVLRSCINELQAATRPEQFMPPLREWPEGAEWCAIDASADCYFYDEEPGINERDCEFDGYSVSSTGGQWPARVKTPLGIDWRTLKVSRQQMEEWEDINA